MIILIECINGKAAVIGQLFAIKHGQCPEIIIHQHSSTWKLLKNNFLYLLSFVGVLHLLTYLMWRHHQWLPQQYWQTPWLMC